MSTERNAEICQQYIDGSTLQQVGAHFKISRERVRQIEAKALRKLRHPSRSKKLRSFVESL